MRHVNAVVYLHTALLAGSKLTGTCPCTSSLSSGRHWLCYSRPPSTEAPLGANSFLADLTASRDVLTRQSTMRRTLTHAWSKLPSGFSQLGKYKCVVDHQVWMIGFVDQPKLAKLASSSSKVVLHQLVKPNSCRAHKPRMQQFFLWNRGPMQALAMHTAGI